MNKSDIKQALSVRIRTDNIYIDEPLHRFTFTHTGGPADLLVLPENYEEVQHAISLSKQHDIPLTILGNGSNLIIQDGGIRGIVLVLTRLNQIQIDGTSLIAQSGASIVDVSKQALFASLTGLEFACGIPGTVGGAVYMNAGAYGGEVSDCLESVLVLDENGNRLLLKANELSLSYRNSILSTKPYLVLEARFRLQNGNPLAIEEKMKELNHLRSSKQPLEYPSCGSVFKRPVGLFAGQLIQECGLQGYRIGGVEVSKKHAGFMVNVDNGTASDYLALIEHVKKTVFDRFAVELETEVKIIGEEKSSNITDTCSHA